MTARDTATRGPDIAVVVCTYRRPERLARAVQEIFDQRGVDNQVVVVVDDGSDDGGRTGAAIDQLLSLHGYRVDVVRLPVNRGVAAARTTGVARAAELGATAVCFHDDDDLWLPNRLADGFAPFADPKVAMTYGDQQRIDDSFLDTGEVNVVWASTTRGYWGTIADGLLRGRVYFPFQTAMFRTEICPQLLPFMPVRESEDLDFALRALRLIRRSPGRRAVHVPRLLAYYVSSIDSLSQTEANRAMRQGVHRQIFSQHVPGPAVDLLFTLSHRLLRPAAIRLGRARHV